MPVTKYTTMNNKQIKEYFEKLNDNIKRQGYQLTYVSSSDSPDFCYSTGIYRTFNIPELFISSLPQGICSDITLNYIEALKDKKECQLTNVLTF